MLDAPHAQIPHAKWQIRYGAGQSTLGVFSSVAPTDVQHSPGARHWLLVGRLAGWQVGRLLAAWQWQWQWHRRVCLLCQANTSKQHAQDRGGQRTAHHC